MIPDELRHIADQIDTSLWMDLIDPWFPRCVDSNGGFWQSFDRRWNRIPSKQRGVVFQARMTWVCASLGSMPGPRQEEFVRYALHGAEYLANVFTEPSTGAVRWAVSKGDPLRQDGALDGHTYGASFAIYALAAVHRLVGSQQALDDAMRAFGWLEQCLHDPLHGGYFECSDITGKPILSTPRGKSGRPGDDIGTPYGQKSQNTHLHLMEAFSELAKSTRDPLVIERLREVKDILQNKLFEPAGWLQAFAKPDWTPVLDRVSYGHNIEAAHLLLDAAETLDGSIDSATLSKSRALVDNTLMFGLDREQGGFFMNGTAGGRPLIRDKVWWVQAEALLGLAKAMELPDAPADEYFETLQVTWDWIRDRQIDREFGGWYEQLRSDGSPMDQEDHKGRKGHMWKAAYHETRALIETSKILRSLAG